MTAAIQGHQDISEMLAWIQPMRSANYVKGLSKLASEIQEKTQDCSPGGVAETLGQLCQQATHQVMFQNQDSSHQS